LICTFAAISALIGLLLGVLLTPALIFIRAKRDSHWDDSNIFNMYRVFAHIALHPGDLGIMVYKNSSKDEKRPFWYINKDEFSEVVQTRPEA